MEGQRQGLVGWQARLVRIWPVGTVKAARQGGEGRLPQTQCLQRPNPGKRDQTIVQPNASSQMPQAAATEVAVPAAGPRPEWMS